LRGWVYIIINEGFPHLIKVGFSSKDPAERARQLDGTASPYKHVVVFELLVSDMKEAEKSAHALLAAHHESKEWFRCSTHIGRDAILKSSPGIVTLDSVENTSVSSRRRRLSRPNNVSSSHIKQGTINTDCSIRKGLDARCTICGNTNVGSAIRQPKTAKRLNRKHNYKGQGSEVYVFLCPDCQLARRLHNIYLSTNESFGGLIHIAFSQMDASEYQSRRWADRTKSGDDPLLNWASADELLSWPGLRQKTRVQYALTLVLWEGQSVPALTTLTEGWGKKYELSGEVRSVAENWYSCEEDGVVSKYIDLAYTLDDLGVGYQQIVGEEVFPIYCGDCKNFIERNQSNSKNAAIYGLSEVEANSMPDWQIDEYYMKSTCITCQAAYSDCFNYELDSSFEDWEK